MLRKSLAVLAFLVITGLPAAGQVVEYEWSDDRPDARPPGIVLGGRILEKSDLQLEYRFGKMSFGDVRLGTESLDLLDVLSVYGGAPFGRTNDDHYFKVSYGLFDWLTLEGRWGWLSRSRQFGNETVFVDNQSSGFSDLEAAALISVYDKGGIKAHLIGGATLPFGSIDKIGPDISGTPRILPYTMQLGTGSIMLTPGAAAMMQNDRATVGASVRALFPLYDNDRDYRYGDAFEGILWANYRLNDNFAVTTGARLHRYGAIQGQDPAMDPLADPSQDPFFSSGTTVVLPLGLSMLIPTGLLAGTDIHFEFAFPAYESFDAPRPEGDWGFNLTLARDVPMFWK